MRHRYSLRLAAALLPLAFGCQKRAANLGCGYVLVLGDGKRLEPHGEVWQNFAKRDGALVTISYVSEPIASVCMVGESVRLTCIQ